MKQSLISIFILALGIQSALSQVSQEKIESFRAEVLPQYRVYFNAAVLSPSGQLELTAEDRYSSLSKTGKSTLMDNLAVSWQESLIVVRYGSKRELWGYNKIDLKAMPLDNWDLEQGPVPDRPASPPSKTAQHPLFFYFGFQEQLDSQKNLNLGFNGRFGFFMLRDRWDLAASFSGFVFGNIDADSQTFQANAGLSSKVYFPVRKFNISPNIGGEIAWTNYSTEGTSTSSVSPFLLAGISWYVGTGSFDIGVRAGKQAMALIGYTFFPKFNSGK